MCPAEGAKPSRKPAVTRKRQSIQNYKVMRWLDEERQRKGLSLRDVAQALGPGYRNATRVGQYFDQRIVAGPDLLQRLAIAVGVSPIDALWNAGHHDAVLDYLLRMYRLGWSWAHGDNVEVFPEDGAEFMLQYEEIGFPAGGDLRIPPPSLADRYHLATVRNSAGIFRHVSLPKPMAIAIMLAVVLFPRRGEKARPEATPFYEQLSVVAANMLPAADLARIPAQADSAMKRPLKAAAAIWKYRFYGSMRLAVIGEYVQVWCDFVCRNYASYARLALYEHGAFIGEPAEGEDIWEWQRTDMPSADEFAMTSKRK